MNVINVVGYEGIYAVSDTGIIFNIKKRNCNEDSY